MLTGRTVGAGIRVWASTTCGTPH